MIVPVEPILSIMGKHYLKPSSFLRKSRISRARDSFRCSSTLLRHFKKCFFRLVDKILFNVDFMSMKVTNVYSTRSRVLSIQLNVIAQFQPIFHSKRAQLIQSDKNQSFSPEFSEFIDLYLRKDVKAKSKSNIRQFMDQLHRGNSLKNG